MGSDFETLPEAIMMLSAVYSSPPATIVRLSLNEAIASTTFTFALFSIMAIPERSWSATSFLRAMTLLKSNEKVKSSMPNFSASLNCATASALRQRHLVGMHPSLRHVPPSCAPLKSVTLIPRRAAERAVS